MQQERTDIKTGTDTTETVYKENIKIVTADQKYFKDLGWNDFASPNEAMEYLKTRKVLGGDTETTGLGSFLKNKVYGLQLGDEGAQYIIITGIKRADGEVEDHSDILQEFKPLLNYYGKHSDILYVFHNYAYDGPYLYNLGVILKNVHCTLTTERILYNGLKKKASLDAVLERNVGVKIDKEVQKTIADTGFNSIEAIKYGATDVRYLPAVYRKQIANAKKWKVIKDIKLHQRYVVVNAYNEYCGVGFDHDKHYQFYREVEYDEWRWKREIERIAKRDWDPDKTEGKTFQDIIDESPTSYLRWTAAESVLILQNLGVRTKIEFGKRRGKHSADIKHLIKRIGDHEIVKPYIKFAKARKLVTTYGRTFGRHVQEHDGRIHTRYNPFVETGRTSSGSSSGDGSSRRLGDGFVNVQNLPNPDEDEPLDVDIRHCFVPQTKSYSLTGADFASQEARMLAELAQEKNMIEFFQSGGGDMHSWVAKMIFPDKIDQDLTLEEVKKKHPDLRRQAKGATFALQYNGTARTLSNNLNIPMHLAEEIYKRYFRAFPGLKNFHKQCIDAAWQNGYLKCCAITGRKRYIGNYKEIISGKYLGDKSSVEYMVSNQAVNNLVQGTSATMTKLAEIYFFDWIMKNKKFGKVKMVMKIHDELVVEHYNTYREAVADGLKYCMETAASQCLNILSCDANPWTSHRYDK